MLVVDQIKPKKAKNGHKKYDPDLLRNSYYKIRVIRHLKEPTETKTES